MECANYKGALEYAFERMRTGPFTRMRTACISHLFNLVAVSSLLVSVTKLSGVSVKLSVKAQL